MRRVILCQNQDGRKFLLKLASAKGLGEFDIRQVGGQSGFESFLFSMAVDTNIRNMKGILIIGDAGADPAQRFASISMQIAKANERISQVGYGVRQYGIPDNPMIAATSQALPRVAISLLPPGPTARGSLESICLQAVYESRPDLMGVVEGLAQPAGASNLEEPALSKLKLRTAVSYLFKDQPDISPGDVWSKNPCPLSMNAECFGQVADLMARFDAVFS